ncbi:MAG: dihydroorotate dehydrogenase-like protein [Candidatus Aminicenantes bacterium]|nr:dihydroorotate dehydrogenase-like protein [Candidatus Aminicenantes bacterium]
MTDLSTQYMGLKLRNPIIVSSCDLTHSVKGIKKCADAGAGAVVLKSIFEEQFLVKGEISDEGQFMHPEALDYLRSGGLLEYAPQKICQTIENAKKEVDIPLIVSINCLTPNLWPRFAKQIYEAGADALELNIYFLPLDLEESGSDFEQRHFEILSKVKDEVSIPISIKLSSQLTSLPNLAKRLADAGTDALVLFNWFLEPDINVNNQTTRSIKGKGNLFQSLKWVALLADRVGCDIASSGGVENSDDIIKMILAGSSAVQACSIFYNKGLGEIESLLKGIQDWMKDNQYISLDDFKGNLSFIKQKLSFKNMGEADKYFRAQYMKTYSKFE